MRKILIWIILSYIKFFAKLAIKLHKPVIIGITGSVGKSSTRNAVVAALKDYFPTKAIEKGNSETGIPLGILGLAPHNYSLRDWMRLIVQSPMGIGYLKGTQYLIVEMGVDEPDPPKNMGYLLTIVKPDISIFLNVFPVHTMQFDQLVPDNIKGEDRIPLVVEKIAQEKSKIITESQCKVGIFNIDNEAVVKQIKSVKRANLTLLSFGQNKSSNLFFKDHRITLSGTYFEFKVENRDLSIELKNYVLPKEYQEVIGAAILAAKAAGLTNDQIKTGIETNFTLPAGRSSIFDGINNSYILDSSYNASKAAVIAFLELVKELKTSQKLIPVFLFGDMRELGEEAALEHMEVAEKVFQEIDYLYCIGSQTKRFIIDNPEFKNKIIKLKEVKWFANSVLAGNYIKDNLPKNSLILVKGSQNEIFLEEAIKPLLRNKQDEEKLCRQSSFWMDKKKKYYA